MKKNIYKIFKFFYHMHNKYTKNLGYLAVCLSQLSTARHHISNQKKISQLSTAHHHISNQKKISPHFFSNWQKGPLSATAPPSRPSLAPPSSVVESTRMAESPGVLRYAEPTYPLFHRSRVGWIIARMIPWRRLD
jgi:hypothetical protein